MDLQSFLIVFERCSSILNRSSSYLHHIFIHFASVSLCGGFARREFGAQAGADAEGPADRRAHGGAGGPEVAGRGEGPRGQREGKA